MARTGIVGSPITLVCKFYKLTTQLFNPDTVEDVKIYNSKVGGTLLATITPAQVSTGVWNAVWNIPSGQTPGTYYAEWTWKATALLSYNVRRYSFTVTSVTVPTVDSKRLKSHLAVGWWGRDIEKRIDCEQIPYKIKALLADKLLSRGKDVFLWKEVIDSTPNVLTCSCVKNTTERPDITCNSCYGVGLIPGYVKFAHETIFTSSISSGLTLTNVNVDTGIKPHRILLDTNQLTGTIESGPIAYSNTNAIIWDVKINVPEIKSTNTVTVEFSTDNITFYPIAEINDPGKIPIGSGYIYLKTTLTRADLADRSPEYEIIRLRHANNNEPFIKILRPQISELPSLMPYGRRVENLGERFWTMPLDFFDPSITEDTPDAKIFENSFYERVRGINVGVRFVTTKLNYNEEFGLFTQQSFEARKPQPEEVYSKLVF